jgi:hypothetical protein
MTIWNADAEFLDILYHLNIAELSKTDCPVLKSWTAGSEGSLYRILLRITTVKKR